MSIPQAVPSQLQKLIFSFDPLLTWNTAATVSTCSEAAFYSTLRGGIQNAGRLFNWIRDSSVTHINKIQMIYNIANLGIVLFCSKKLLDEVLEKFPSVATNLTGKSSNIKAIPVALAIGGAVAVVVFVYKGLCPTLKPEQEVEIGNQGNDKNDQQSKQIVKISEQFGLQQKFAQVLNTTKLVLNLALACFVKNRYLMILSVAGSAYCLLKNMDIKWITFSRIFPFAMVNPNVPITQVKATYHMLALPVGTSAAEENCPICLDNQTDMAFCTNHVFHQTCMAQVCVTKSESYVDECKFTKNTTSHYTNGFHTHTSYDYQATIPEDSLPNCPICKISPFQNECDLEVTDAAHGVFNAAVTIERPPMDRQYLFENLYAIYSVAQASLAYLQTYSKLSAAIFTIQKVMMVTDVIAYAMTTYYLYDAVVKRFELEDSTALKIAVVAAIVSVAVLSWFAIAQLNAYLKSALILKDLLAQLEISPDILNTIDIAWNAPLTQNLLQCLYINRMVTTAALAFFSEQWKTNLLSATAQMLSFVGISNLKWIEITQTINLPLREVVASGGTLFGNITQGSLRSLKATYYYLVNPSCTTDATHLKSTLQSIYNYTTTFFNNSTWDRYWMIKRINGIEVGRTLYYTITLQNHPIDPCGCTLIPSLGEYTVSIADALYYNTAVKITGS